MQKFRDFHSELLDLLLPLLLKPILVARRVAKSLLQMSFLSLFYVHFFLSRRYHKGN